MKRIIIHIGRPKTGTTALQAFFAGRRSLLKERGIHYPMASPETMPNCKVGHTPYSLEIAHILHSHKLAKWKGDARAEIEATLQKSLASLLTRVEAAACETVLISNEHLLGLGPKLLIPLLADYHVTVVCYIRRQDEIIQSAYIQQVRSPLLRSTGTIHDLIKQPHFINRFDYHEKLMDWGEAVGLENMVVRVYDKKSLSDGIVADFFKAVGIPLSQATKAQAKIMNPGISRLAIALLRTLNRVPMTRRMHLLTQHYVTKLFARPLHQPHVLLNAEEKHKIMERFEDSNQAVARLYLGREDGELFPAD